MSGTDSTGQLVNTTEATMPAPSAAFALRDADVSQSGSAVTPAEAKSSSIGTSGRR